MELHSIWDGIFGIKSDENVVLQANFGKLRNLFWNGGRKKDSLSVVRKLLHNSLWGLWLEYRFEMRLDYS